MIAVLGTQGITASALGIKAKSDNTNNPPALKVKSNIPGQGASIPMESIWEGHAVVLYNCQIYDPSYGKKYGYQFSYDSEPNALTQFLTKSVESVGRTCAPDQGVQTYGYGNLYIATTEASTISDVYNYFEWEIEFI